MLSKPPIDLTRVAKDLIDRQILRSAIISELDAINFYEQMAALASDDDLRQVLMDIAGEEKTHVGEFKLMLMRLDPEQVKEFEQAKIEIKDITGK